MITAIDTSVLMTIARQGERWEKWAKALTKAASEGSLVVSCVVFGEFSQGYSSADLALEQLGALHIHYDPMRPETVRYAYRQHLKGCELRQPESHRLPYHLISAHASLQADRLAVDSIADPSHDFPGVTLLYC